MIRIVKCAVHDDGQIAMAYRQEPDDGLYHDMCLSTWDGHSEGHAYVNIETAIEMIGHLREFISIMEDRKRD